MLHTVSHPLLLLSNSIQNYKLTQISIKQQASDYLTAHRFSLFNEQVKNKCTVIDWKHRFTWMPIYIVDCIKNINDLPYLALALSYSLYYCQSSFINCKTLGEKIPSNMAAYIISIRPHSHHIFELRQDIFCISQRAIRFLSRAIWSHPRYPDRYQGHSPKMWCELGLNLWIIKLSLEI